MSHDDIAFAVENKAEDDGGLAVPGSDGVGSTAVGGDGEGGLGSAPVPGTH